MEQNKKLFEIRWPFWQCQAILPNAIGHDIFVWLYLSLLVRIVKGSSNPSRRITEKQMQETRRLIRSKFSEALISDNLLKEIEEKVKKDFCNETEFKEYDLIDGYESFLNSFEELFSNEVEVQTIYKDAVSGAIVPYFGPIKYYGDKPSDNAFSFNEGALRPKEPTTSLVFKALKLSKSVEAFDDPLTTEETKETIIADIDFDENEEVYEDDTIDFGDEPLPEEEEATASTTAPMNKRKKTVKVLEDSYRRWDLTILVHEDEHGELMVDPPIEFPMNKATTAWFNGIFRKAVLTNEALSGALNAFFPKPKVQENIKPENMLKIFSENGKLDKCQELFETVGHSQSQRADLQLEVIRINDNFHGVAGYFHVGRLLDLLGRTIPDNTVRVIDLETYRINMRCVCNELGLGADAQLKLTDRYIYNEYARPFKISDKLPFKELIANAILNNLACRNNQFFYKEVIADAWDLYGKRSRIDHTNGDVRLTQEDIEKLTKLTKFIISIQRGKTL